MLNFSHEMISSTLAKLLPIIRTGFLILGPHLIERVCGHLLLKEVALLIPSQPLRATMPQFANRELCDIQTPKRRSA